MRTLSANMTPMDRQIQESEYYSGDQKGRKLPQPEK